MAIFMFDRSHFLGRVREVDTQKVTLLVETDEDLRKARVGQLVALALTGAVDAWLIGIIAKVTKSVVRQLQADDEATDDETGMNGDEHVVNMVRLTLVGTVSWDAIKKKNVFSRSLAHVPEIDSECNVLRDAQLEAFMGILVAEGDKAHSLALGKYSIDEKATAYLDGNKFFQRHAALLGSTGSGKSWAVASILERTATLPTANIIVFDLHGEYQEMSYARHLRIPGPEELGTLSDNLLYLPYWLLNAEEMQAMFIDRSEFSAHNQVMAFQDAVIEEKSHLAAAQQERGVGGIYSGQPDSLFASSGF